MAQGSGKQALVVTEPSPAPRNPTGGTTGGKTKKSNRKVKIIQTPETDMLTDLWAEVFIVGEEPHGFPAMFARARCTKAKELHKADIVLFTGGVPDVSPELYGETRHKTTLNEEWADLRDIQVFQEAAYLGIPMVGVCRGAQFLHVMNHGKLFQDVDNHNSWHEIYDKRANEYIGPVSSVHHQMCRPNPENGMEVIAVAYESSTKHLNATMSYTQLEKTDEEDIEAFWYPETACLGVQGHPEYRGYDEYTAWFIDLIDQYIIENPDISLTQGNRRLKPEVIDRRKWRMPQSAFDFMKKYG